MKTRLLNKIPLASWLGYWRLMRRYHRYEVDGIQYLKRPGAALIVGYHGRPLAYDFCMLTVTIYEELGYMPHGVIHGAVDHLPVFKWLSDGLGFITGDSASMRAAVERGEHILVQPGGTREGCRSYMERYKVAWGDRTGYLKLALRYGIPIVPAASHGVDDGYIGLNDGYALGKRLNVPHRLPLWFGIGPLGLWPLSPPFPVKIKQVIGEPIDLNAFGPVDINDKSSLLRLNQIVIDAVQALLDRTNSR